MGKILLIDDEIDLCEMLSILLEMNGHRVKICYGAHQAISLLKAESFDLVLSDIHMPEGDGVILSQWVDAYLPKLPLIFMTGARGSEGTLALKDRLQLPKPLDHEFLLRTIEGHLQQA